MVHIENISNSRIFTYPEITVNRIYFIINSRETFKYIEKIFEITYRSYRQFVGNQLIYRTGHPQHRYLFTSLYGYFDIRLFNLVI